MIKKYNLEITVFICSFAIMMLELVASRILSPYVGSSNIVWTSIIGIILLSSSIGNYIGGILSDKYKDKKILSLLILSAGIYILAIPIFSDSLLYAITSISSIKIAAILSTFLVFFIPSLILGTVSPYTVKLRVNDLNSTGKTTGILYSISTFGSIIGTFVAGFILIPLIGSRQNLIVIGLLLIFLSLFLHIPDKKDTSKIIITTILIMLILLFSMGNILATNGIVDIDTEYSRVFIVEDIDTDKNSKIRSLIVGKGQESAMFVDNPYELVSKYTQYYDLMNCYKIEIKDTLLIGGAGYVYPTYFLNKYKDRHIDVIEIDSKMTELAIKYFNLNDTNKKLGIYHEDGRTYLNQNSKKYDIVLNDAFKGLTAPFNLATIEAVEKIYNSLNDEGVYITNIISAIDGNDSKMIKAQANTIRQVFPYVDIYACAGSDDKIIKQNFIVVASKIDYKNITDVDENLTELLNKKINIDINEDIIVLTDNFAPIEYYTDM